MNAAFYNEFRNFADIGDRRSAAECVRKFVDSFEGKAERRAWVREFLEHGEYGHKIRHELYRDLVFPELLVGYRTGDPWCLYFLADTIQNVYDVREFHERLEWQSDYSLLLTCYRVAPNFRDVRVQLLGRACRSLNYAIHEWPAGLCCEIEDVESDLTLAKKLDIDGEFTLMFADVDAIITEARIRG
ncbi:MAG: hypothetical protein H7A51_13575 [Akkermansiaceae bacterium]|nr:hypothetical protein [Akkermansiaceae bacterium]